MTSMHGVNNQPSNDLTLFFLIFFFFLMQIDIDCKKFQGTSNLTISADLTKI